MISTESIKKYSLFFPGNWIDHEDRDWAFRIYLLLSLVENQFSEAVIAQSLYKSVTPTDYLELIKTWDDENTKYNMCVRSMYAKLCVYALDGIGKLLGVLSEDPCLPKSAKDYCRDFENRFGIIRDIRNSLQHLEDRARGLGPKNKKIDTNVYVLGGLKDNKFCATIANGSCGEIEISEEMLVTVKEIIQKIINSFTWIGLGGVRIPPKS